MFEFPRPRARGRRAKVPNRGVRVLRVMLMRLGERPLGVRSVLGKRRGREQEDRR
jgi:hypothetical protein